MADTAPATPAAPVDPITPAPTPGGSGVQTSEFYGLITVIIANVLATLVILGIVSASDKDAMTKMLTTLVSSLSVAIPSVVGLWKYISSRIQVKQMAHEQTMQVMAMRYPSVAAMRFRNDGPCKDDSK